MKQPPFSIDVLTVAALLLLARTLHAERLTELLDGTERQMQESGFISENPVLNQKNPVEDTRQSPFFPQETITATTPSAARRELYRSPWQAGPDADFHRETAGRSGCQLSHGPPRRFCSRW